MNIENEANGFTQELAELRNLIVLDAERSLDKYHIRDIQRVKEDNRYLTRFLLAKKGNVKDAFKMIKSTLEWRKNFDVFGITKDSIPARYFTSGALLPFNKDKRGNIVLLLRIKQYKRPSGEEEFIRKFIIYWLETMDREYCSEQITVVFNCKDCGISNLDMDLVRFMITAFTNYYPRFLCYILIFEMPWLYNAAWRMIKSWLPENSADKIRMVNRESVLEYIDKSQLHLEMGGMETIPAPLSNESQEILKDKQLLVPNICNNEQLVYVNPSHKLKFSHHGFTETVNSDVTFSISNVSKSVVWYKIKTTSRERYRAWPYSGLIQPGDHITIKAQLINNAVCQENDKFLILISKISDNVLTKEVNYHISTQSDAVVEYKLRCVMDKPPSSSERKNRRINNFQIENAELKRLQIRLLQIEQNVIVLQQRQVFWLSFGCMLLILHILLNNGGVLYSFIDYLL